MRIHYFDYFRAISIIFIVAGHSCSPWRIDTLPEMVVANLITGGTALFVFISGFFFHHTFYPKFQFGNFLIKKCKNVFLPYIILSICGFLFFVVALNQPNPHLDGDVVDFTNSFILSLKYLWTGRILLAYWYIPFIMIVFSISPFFIKYITLSQRSQIFIFFFCLAISMIAHRPLYNLSPVHSVIYFMPIYMLGIIFSINSEKISNFVNNKSFVLGIATLLIAFIQVYKNNSFGNYHKGTIMSYRGIDIFIIQKIFMIFFFLSILQKLEKKEIGILKYLATVSFAIYFLHPWVLWFLKHISFTDYLSIIPGGIIFPLKTVLVISISITIAILFKIILGKKSRYVVGY